MSATVGTETTGCGCGAATIVTPIPIANRPGLSAIAYRAGTYATFRDSMIAALSRSDLPQLRGLATRDSSDFSLAFIDAWATAADVLTFYQERIANEAYLRTAVERMSVGFLAGLIGYQPRPGVAASTVLAFQLDTAPGAPATTTIPAGTQVQSVPGAGQTSQTFETIETIEGRPAWNALAPSLTAIVAPSSTFVYLQGTATNLKPGDPLLFVDQSVSPGPLWDFVRVVAVAPDTKTNRTLVTLNVALTKPYTTATMVFALRQRASLWGYNAPDWLSLTSNLQAAYPNGWDVDTKLSSNRVSLDAVYPHIVAGGWVVFSQTASLWSSPVNPGDALQLFSVADVHETSVARYLLNGKATVLDLDGPGTIADFTIRGANLFAQSDALALAEGPYVDPNSLQPTFNVPLLQPGTPSAVEGESILIGQAIDGLTTGQTLTVTGQRIHVQVVLTGISLTPPVGAAIPLAVGQILEVMASPVQSNGAVTWSLRTLDGSSGTLVTQLPSYIRYFPFFLRLGLPGIKGNLIFGSQSAVTIVPAPKTATVTTEVVTLALATPGVDSTGRPSTALLLQQPLENSYDRTTVTLCANVANATHGATVNEVLGNGDASQPFQSFTLKQSPLTFTSAANSSGASSSVALTVNDATWTAAASLYGQSASARVYITEVADDASTTIEFGDGTAGARLPTGAQNVRATYRVGLGTVGNLAPGTLTLLAARPLGVRSVVNPIAASGGGDPELLADARANAGLTIRTLDRVVSLLDYQNFAQAFAGIGKATADWVWDGRQRSVLLTVAAADGSLVDPASALAQNLVAALVGAGDPFVSIIAASYKNVTFMLGLLVVVEPDYVNASADVLAAIEAALRARFSFAQRSFAQPVTYSEVIAVAQQVTGVLAINVTSLYRSDAPPPLNPAIQMRLPALPAAPPPAPGAPATGAELLTLDPGDFIQLAVLK